MDIAVHFARTVAPLLCAAGALVPADRASAQAGAEPAYQSRFVQVRGIRMHYLDFGGSGLPVIFIHGSHGNARSFVDFAPRFADGFRVLALDRRGFGESEDVEWGHGTAAQAEDVLGFMDALGLERAVLIGNVAGPTGLMVYLGEHHPERLAGMVYLAHMGPDVPAHRDPAVAEFWDMGFRTACDWDEETRRRVTESARYRPHFVDDPDFRIDVPALSFANAEGTRYPADFDFVGVVLQSVETGEWCDPTAKAYFAALAADTARANELRSRLGDLSGAANLGRFERAFGPRMNIVRLSVPAVSGYEYQEAPDLIYPHIRRFLETLDRDNEIDADTVRVAPPTGVAETDRPSVQEAFDRVGPGGVVLFASGTYMLGEGARLTVPDVTVLGHPDGTVLQGCEPERFDLAAADGRGAIGELAMGCTALYLLADRQTIRGLTFDHAGRGIFVGVPRESEDGPAPPSFGGHVIENNVFRHVPIGIRVVGPTDDVTVIRDNEVENAYHALSSHGAPVHVLDNRITVPEPWSVPATHYPESGVTVGPGYPSSSCSASRVEGNVIEGTVHGIQVLGGAGGACADIEIRDNEIQVREVALPPDYPRHLMDWLFGEGSEGSTVDGIAIRLDGAFDGPLDDTVAATVTEVLVQDNRVLGGRGLGIQVARASNNRIVGNHISEIRRRSPFPGLTWGEDPERWREANGAGIWVSPDSEGNEITGNTFEDVAGAAVVLEGENNSVELRGADDVVRDLGSGNEVIERTDETERASAPGEAGGLEVGQQPALADTLRDLAVESMALWNRLDPDAWLSLLADDIRWYYSATSIDRAGVEEMVRGLMSVMREPRYRVLSDPDVQTLGPDAAVVSFPVLQAATGPRGGQLEQPTGLTFVYQRGEAGWEVTRVHESLGTPADSVVADIVLGRTRDLAAAWERLDADAYLAHFSDDLTFYFEGARVSRREFESVVRGAIGSLRESTFEVLDPEVEVLGRQAAAVSFGLRERMIDASGGETDLNGMLTLIYEARGGQWLVVRAHESLRRPAEAEGQ